MHFWIIYFNFLDTIEANRQHSAVPSVGNEEAMPVNNKNELTLSQLSLSHNLKVSTGVRSYCSHFSFRHTSSGLIYISLIVI